MSNTRQHLRRTGRITLLTTAFGLALATGALSPAFATGSSSSPQPISNADANHGGANGQCPKGPYCSTRNGSPSLNGNGKGKAVGKPCAGCVGKADNKNPKGQMPNGSDHNAGYECDRNHGIGRTNPAHTGCKPVVPPTKHETCTESRHETQQCRPAVVTPPAVTPVVKPPAAVTPAVLVSPAEAAAPAAAQVLESPAEAAVGPLPTAAAAGQADTSGRLTAGGFAGFAAFLALGTGFALRRRPGVI
jgi:hypothetical protein